MSFEVFDNENMALGENAGIQSAQFIAFKGIKVVITANIGKKAAMTLSAAGVKLITGQKGTVRKAIEDYKVGKLKITDKVSDSEDYDIEERVGLGRGRGRGLSRGSRMGRGRGR
jgi:predicted Fe-Mo cluster-binding NifX family protein